MIEATSFDGGCEEASTTACCECSNCNCGSCSSNVKARCLGCDYADDMSTE